MKYTMIILRNQNYNNSLLINSTFTRVGLMVRFMQVSVVRAITEFSDISTKLILF